MKRKTLTLGSKVAINTGTLILVVALVVVVGLTTTASLSDSFRKTASSTVRQLELAQTVDIAKSDMAAGQRGVLLSGYANDEAGVAAADTMFLRGALSLRQSLAELRGIASSDHSRDVLSHLDSAASSWSASYSELKRHVDSGDLVAAMRVWKDTILPRSADVGNDADELARISNALLQGEVQAARDRLASSRWLLILLGAGGLCASVASIFIMRRATADLRQAAVEMLCGSRQVAAASGQVASASQSLAQGASEQAATLQETSSSTTEITAITSSNAQHTQKVAGLMTATVQLVNEANRNLEEMVRSMAEINESSERISKIIRVIDEIAFQTNILALNAAVEAARAGEAGMGFAVVADEVRSLAHRSAQAAKDTASLIEESIGKSNDGSRKLSDVAKSFQQITGSALQVKTLVDEIEVGSREQSRGIEQIAKAVGQMEQVTQRSAATSQQSAAASEELAGQAQGLYEVVEHLRTIVGEATSRNDTRGERVSLAPPDNAGSRRIANAARSRGNFLLEDEESRS